jgi:hypothetical protein
MTDALFIEREDGTRFYAHSCVRCGAVVLAELLDAHSTWHDTWNGGR